VTVLTVLVVVETIVVALLSVVVVALLRSHAEILRRLPENEHDHLDQGPRVAPLERPGPADAPAIPAHLPGPRGTAATAHDVAGRTLDGDAVAVSMANGQPTLIAFLSSGCLTCRTFWDGLRDGERRPLPGDARLMVIVKDPELESPSKLRELAPRDLLVIQSSKAWEDYGVTMSPYFCFVDGDTVRSEGAAMTWDQVRSLLTDALMDEELARRGAG
jgi:hypothetical protein